MGNPVVPTLTKLVDFDNADGANPRAGLLADAAGDLFGTGNAGGADNNGSVFEIAAADGGYASTPATLVSLTSGIGFGLPGGLVADAAGDLFGVIQTGGADGDGSVVEIARTSGGYASTPTVLARFSGADGSGPQAGVIVDAAGDLFGTTQGGGTTGYGTVYEIACVDGSYASAPTALASFNGTDGANPVDGLFADAAGDLFGTTQSGGADNAGTVFEIARTGAGYAGTPTELASFNYFDGAGPVGSLIADAAGDLFGTTMAGGEYGDGTVFEIVRTAGTYASTPTLLVSFNSTDGAYPEAALIADAAGDLFGTTASGGADNYGTVFEVANDAGTYASTPTVVFSFTGLNGVSPKSTLIADAAGDLFGTTNAGGANADGTVFELSGTPFQIAGCAWSIDAAGDFDDPTRWSGGTAPGSGSDAVIDFADDPQVLHDADTDTVASLTNMAGEFVMAGGTLTAGTLTNDSAMSWTSGALILNAGTAGTATLLNTATGSLAIAPNGQVLTAIGVAASSFVNAGTITVDGALGVASIDASLTNTGDVAVIRGTLSLNGGGSSNAALLQTGTAGVLEFGAPGGEASGGTFTLTGGTYGGVDTVISGSTLNAATAPTSLFFTDLSLSASGALLLGGNNAQSNGDFEQTTGSANAGGVPFLSGSGTFSVYGGLSGAGGAALSAGVQSGSGLTRLYGTGSIGGSFALDGGRTIENDGILDWSSGNIMLGQGDPSVVTQSGTLHNLGILYVTAYDGRLGVGAGGSGVLANARVAAFYAGAGTINVDASVANTGDILAASGTLSLNGGGSSNAASLYVDTGATLQFGAVPGATRDATFTLTGGVLTADSVVISGSTVDATAAGSLSMNTLQLAGSGALLLGGTGGQTSVGFSQGPGTWGNASGTPLLSGSGTFAVYGGANLTAGVQSGSGLTEVYGTSVIGGAGVSLDGGRTLENYGWLNWSAGNITLGSGDAGAVTQAGTLGNAAGATLYVTASGERIANASGGVVANAGVIAVYAGGGAVNVDAMLSNTGYVQALSGMLSLNGGGSSGALGLIEGAGAVLQFGTAASGSGGTFTVTGGFYSEAVTQVTGGTLDLSAASGVAFGSSVAVSGGAVLNLGTNYVAANAISLGGGGMLRGNGDVVVSGPAVLGSAVLSGSGTMVLEAGGSIGGTVQLDGGLTLQNAGTLDWTVGSIALGSGDAAAATQAGVLNNVSSGVFDIEADGTIASPGAGQVFNAGVIDKLAGLGTTVVSAGVDNTGTVIVSAGTLAMEQSVGGAGAFVLDGVATLDLAGGAGSGGTMQFLHPGGTLETAALGTFASTISGFAPGDGIDAAGVGFVPGTTTVGFSGGTLTVTDGAQKAAFSLTGSYEASGFQIGSDGHGGTGVGYS